MSKLSGRRRAIVLISLLAVTASACGDDDETSTASSPAASAAPETTAPSDTTASATTVGTETTAGSDTTAGTDTAAATGEGLTGLEAVYAAVDGLEGEERFAKLVELAKQESGRVSSYTSEIDEMNVMVEERWKADTGLGIEIFRETSTQNLERLLQEKASGQTSADIVLLNASTMWPAVDEGLCADLPENLPAAEGVVEGGVYDNWIVAALSIYLPIWNTDRVSGDRLPTSWQDIFSGRYGNTLGVEPTSWNRVAVVIQHIAEEEGISEEEAIELVRPGFEQARAVPGHSVLQGMLNTGELDIAIQYLSVANPDIAGGAPVGFAPAITPIPTETNGLCIISDTPNPATALLYLEWRLTTGQAVGNEAMGMVGSNPNYSPAPNEVLGVGVDDIVLIPREIYDDADKWTAVLEDLVGGA